MSATRGSPLGCIVGFLAAFPFGLAIIGAYGCFKWLQLPEAKRPEGMLSVWISCGACGLVLGIALVWLSFKMMRRGD